MNIQTIAKVGMEAFSARGALQNVRQARAEGDKLKLLDAVVQGLAIATAVALILREVKQQRDAKNALKFEE